MVINKKWVYLPIETKSREYKGKLLLACFLAENDFGVIIGDKLPLLNKLIWFPKGIYLSKGIAFTLKSRFEFNKELDNKIVAFDEEGLIFSKKRRRKLFGQDCFQLSDKYLAWGKNEYDFISEIIENGKEKIKLTGNSRFDLLRPELRHIFDDEFILSKYDPYILINTNFAWYTHFKGPTHILNYFIDRYINNLEWQNQKIKENFMNRFKEKQNHHKNNYFEFVKMIKYLAKTHEDVNIIVRPHPSAGKEKYKNTLESYENVYVIKEGNANKWIKNSTAVVHNSCTTGVEAFLMNKPVISYRPFTSSKFDLYLPNVVSKRAKDKEELSKTVDSILNYGWDDEKYTKKINIAKEHIASVDNKMASKLITEELKNMNVQKQKFNTIDKNNIVNKIIKSSFSYPKKTFSHPKKVFKNIEDIIIKRKSEFMKDKNPGINLEEITNDIETFEKSLDELKDIKYEKLFENIFMVYK